MVSSPRAHACRDAVVIDTSEVLVGKVFWLLVVVEGLILVGGHPFLGSCLCQWVCSHFQMDVSLMLHIPKWRPDTEFPFISSIWMGNAKLYSEYTLLGSAEKYIDTTGITPPKAASITFCNKITLFIVVVIVGCIFCESFVCANAHLCSSKFYVYSISHHLDMNVKEAWQSVWGNWR